VSAGEPRGPMRLLERFAFFLRLSRSHGIARRYFVVNGFDGALTMLGLCTGFLVSGDVSTTIAIRACLGVAIALSVSGCTSAYLSEWAERRRWLADLQEAMLSDLSDSSHGSAARLVPVFIAAVNGFAPLAISLVIICPLWLARAGVPLPLAPLEMAIATAFVCIFAIGLFLGRIGRSFWLWSGARAVLIAMATVALILLIEAGS
jgi:predicted membrane protein (TIGR00267 family)